MEKVISKLSNEELDLVVGGTFGEVMKEIGSGMVYPFVPKAGAKWYGLVAQYVADVVMLTVPAFCAYFFGTKKQGSKEEAK